jgi:hypothetical protein
MLESSDLQFLRQIRNDIDKLPYQIWENSDINDPEYPNKRKKLIGKVMHIDNKLQGYLTKKYKDSSLQAEFSNYSFFTKGYVANTFNVVNNDAWRQGRSSFLCFVDKLIDFAECENALESESMKSVLFKVTLLIFVSFVSLGLAFLDFVVPDISFPISILMKHRLFFVIGVLVISSFFMWKRRDITIPLVTTYLGALLDRFLS